MLTLQDTGISAVLKLAGGNPGALRVCCELLKDPSGMGIGHLLNLDDMGMKGPAIWIGYKDFAKEDLPTFIKALNDRDPKMVDVVRRNGEQAWTGGRG